MNIKTCLTAMTVALTTLGATSAYAEGERFVFVSHAPDSDSWWNTIKTALTEAEAQLGVTVEYRNPPTGDIADMARIIEQAAATNPDGIISSLADFDALSGPLTDAIERGIPVITVNSGTEEQSAKIGAMMHIGQPESLAGRKAGERAMAEASPKSFLCVNHYITNAASVDRCSGFAEGIGVDLGSQMIDSGQDPSEIKNKVLAYLAANPETDAILTLGPTSAAPTLEALKENGLAGEIYFGTFDLSAEIADGIKNDVISWAIDQQPYYQGYLPVVLLTNFNRYGLALPSNIASGPGFVTKDTIDLVAEEAGVHR
ncbi:sugar ABC transporter substrate-binding protein [Phaeobacter italicus]|uniref:sugar ABC transporter substrate-binding protein n=1 Tax=Phaeobacter italicus TaxID=481446 RepID=UPI001AD9A226|nr:sugar ABC transporter substrate-binding protein [Phaeobacter italicus]MBO9443890.1 sugar ABC transporter substrate-binding protein [Phaeobacter italicus]